KDANIENEGKNQTECKTKSEQKEPDQLQNQGASLIEDLYISDNDDLFDEDLEEFQISENDIDMDMEGYHRLIRQIVKLKHSEATPVIPIQKEKMCNPVLKKVVYKTFQFYQRIQEKRVLLNIGGKIFQTSRVTLKADPTSVFAVMFRRGCPFRPYARDTYYFDRDPSHFRFILNYLRNGGYLDILTLPHEKKYLLELLQEVRFYMLGGLEELVVKRLRQVTRTEDDF
ncbi:MAG: BTB/POZ domain-containing protein, partial [Candidatus Thiodiazotropha sp.]